MAESTAPLRGTARIAIVAALPEELQGVRRRARASRRLGRGLIAAEFAGEPVFLARLGMGAERSVASLQRLLEGFAVSEVWAIGAAGALTPDFAEGEVFLPARLLGPNDPEGILLCERSLVAITSPRTTLYSAPSLLATAGAKRALAQQLRLPRVAVDLESLALAQCARGFARPFQTLRVISDFCDEDLPEFLSLATRANGDLDLARVICAILRRPQSNLPAAMRLARRMRRGADQLAVALEARLREARTLAIASQPKG